MQQSLLIEFIRNELANYREPHRQGTPRGDRIGFSTVKYRASLLALANNDLREVAGLLGVSYGLLRKWRTEPEFKKVVNDHCDKFTVIFFKHLLALAYESRKKQDDFLKKPLNVIAKSKLPDTSYNWERIRDCIGYSSTLNIKLGEVIDKILDDKYSLIKKKGIVNDKDQFIKLMFIVCFFYMDVAMFINKTSNINKCIGGKDGEYVKRFVFGMIRDTLRKPEITEEDRKLALYALAILDR